jgi:tetratricopeptide (TPR) repeat protein
LQQGVAAKSVSEEHMTRLLWLPLVLCFVTTPVPAAATTQAQQAGSKKVVSADETAQRDKLRQAQRLIADGKSTDAIAIIDQVLAHYAARYPEGETRWYVARTMEESLYYMAEATMSSKDASGKSNASSLIVAWADAYFLKGYALNELNQPADAKLALEQAVQLSPENATYLIELAEAYKLERNWDECYRMYQAAEDAAVFSPPQEQLTDRAQAKRGQAFVFVEQGKLDQAQKLLEECLKLNANDARAKKELDYIAQLRKQSAHGERK